MAEISMDDNGMKSAVIIELDSLLDQLDVDREAVRSAVETAVCRRVADLTATLGIPTASPAMITFNSDAGYHLPADRLVRIWINGKECRYPDELVGWVYSYGYAPK